VPLSVEARLFDVVVMVGSLGGPEAIREVVSGLPEWFPAGVVVVQHRAANSQNVTVEPEAGRVHVAPADRQLVIAQDGAYASLPGRGTPGRSADAFFESIARHFRSRAIAVVLSGANDDGAAGAASIRRAGGRVIAQARAGARCYTMPGAAIATGCVDLVLPAERIAAAVVSLVSWPGAAHLLRTPLSPWAAAPYGDPWSIAATG
jgi:two-component system chemotaxis response regulator CheB